MSIHVFFSCLSLHFPWGNIVSMKALLIFQAVAIYRPPSASFQGIFRPRLSDGCFCLRPRWQRNPRGKPVLRRPTRNFSFSQRRRRRLSRGSRMTATRGISFFFSFDFFFCTVDMSELQMARTIMWNQHARKYIELNTGRLSNWNRYP